MGRNYKEENEQRKKAIEKEREFLEKFLKEEQEEVPAYERQNILSNIEHALEESAMLANEKY